jgi:hypothetical protein
MRVIIKGNIHEWLLEFIMTMTMTMTMEKEEDDVDDDDYEMPSSLS